MEMAAYYLRHYPGISLDRLRKSQKFMSGSFCCRWTSKWTPKYKSDILFFLLFYVGMKLGLLQEVKNMCQQCQGTGWWGINLGLRWVITGDYRMLHKEELYYLCPCQIWNQEQWDDRTYDTHREKVNAYRVLKGKLKGKRQAWKA